MRVIDSSVLAALILQEPGWENLASHLLGITLDLALLETVNAVIKSLRRGKIEREDAVIRITALRSLKTLEIKKALDVLPQAADLALNSRLTIYDAAFIALARQETLPLVTLDKLQHEEAVKLGVPSILLKI